MENKFILPELGEHIEDCDVVNILVSIGDHIEEGQPVLEVETEKAIIEVPSSVSGVITGILVKKGEKAKVGQTILTVEEAVEVKAPTEATAQAPEAAERSKDKDSAPSTPPTNLDAQEETITTADASVEKNHSETTFTLTSGEQGEIESNVTRPSAGIPGKIPQAAPSVRRFARELGIDIGEVKGSHASGRISVEDVKNYARSMHTKGVTPYGITQEPSKNIVYPSISDFSKWGKVERKSMSRVRLATAEHLSIAWNTIPHVTNFDKADITELEQLRKRFKTKAEAQGGKLTLTAIMLKVVVTALKNFPQFNASLDMANKEIIYKKYYNIGVAVDTEHGLLVPVIRDVDKKNILELSIELVKISEKARNRKLSPEEMQGGTFTITNLGGIGGTYFSPIINFPETAILGLSRSRKEPVCIDDKFQTRLILPLTVSYDHRVIDGATAARFLELLVELCEKPFLMTLEG